MPRLPLATRSLSSARAFEEFGRPRKKLVAEVIIEQARMCRVDGKRRGIGRHARADVRLRRKYPLDRRRVSRADDATRKLDLDERHGARAVVDDFVVHDARILARGMRVLQQLEGEHWDETSAQEALCRPSCVCGRRRVCRWARATTPIQLLIFFLSAIHLARHTDADAGVAARR